MDEVAFWRIIDATVDAEDQEEALARSLRQLPDHEIVAFQKHLDVVSELTERSDIRGAANIVLGGCTGVGSTDDTFLYFSLWLVSLGKRRYDAVLRDADALADFAAFGAGFEALMYVARRVYEERPGAADFDAVYEELPEPTVTWPVGREIDSQSLWEPHFMVLERAKVPYPRLCAWLVENGLDY